MMRSLILSPRIRGQKGSDQKGELAIGGHSGEPSRTFLNMSCLLSQDIVGQHCTSLRFRTQYLFRLALRL